MNNLLDISTAHGRELRGYPNMNDARTTPYTSKAQEGLLANTTSVSVVLHYAYKRPVSIQARRVIDSLKEFGALPENWDSYGAVRIGEGVIEDAIRVVKAFDALQQEVYFVAPGPNGEISLELENSISNRSLEILIYPDNKWKYLRFEAKDFVAQGNMTTHDIRSHQDWLQGR